MKVRFYGNATVVITSPGGAKVLCDPWFTQGAFLGSWFTYPPAVQDFEPLVMNEQVDAIYISHLHTDHFDRKFLAKYLRIHPETPIVISRFAHPWLIRSIQSLNGGNVGVFEIGASEAFTVKDLRLKILAADECNSLVCGTQIPCFRPNSDRSIDSVAIFEASGLKILNANDAMGLDFAKRMWPLIGNVDLVMGHYAGASPYPQCFPDVRDVEEQKETIIFRACENLGEVAERLKARHVLPFAGQYILGGKLVRLNDKRAVCSAQETSDRLGSQGLSAIPFSLAVGGEFDLKKEEVSALEDTPPSKVRRVPTENSAKSFSL